MLFKSALYKALGKHISVLPWTGHFDGNAFVKKCPGGIAPTIAWKRAEQTGSIEADRLHTIA